MASKRFIKSLKDEKNINIIQLIKSFMYGDSEISEYEDTTIYNKGSVVIKFDPTTNRFNTYRCIVTQSSNTWVESEWRKETAGTAIFNVNDKLIIHSNTKPDVVTDNKLWFHDIKKNTDGTINTITKIKNDTDGYETLYTATVTENVYLDTARTNKLSDKLDVMDIERTRIRSEYLMEVLNLLFELGVALPNSRSQKFITILDTVSPDVEISGMANVYNNIISI